MTASLLRSLDSSQYSDRPQQIFSLDSSPISNFSSVLSNPQGTVTSVQLQLVLLLPSCSTAYLVLWRGLSTPLSFSFLWFSFWGPPRRQQKKNPLDSKFSFLSFTSSGLLTGIRWFIRISKSLRILCVFFSRTDYGLCMHHLVVWSNFHFLHNSQWITFCTQSCLVLYSLYVRLLHSLIMRFMVISQSLLNPHLLFCCVLFIFTLT